MKVIFLDVDGVLNWAGTEDRIDGFIGLDPSRIERFNKIIEAHPDVKIVVSSTWRKCMPFMTAYQDFEGLKELFAARGLKGHIIGHTPITFGGRARGDEIRDWIKSFQEETGDKLEAFVVLDDDTRGMAPYVGEHFIGYDEDKEEIWAPSEELDLRPFHAVTDWTGDPNLEGEQGGLQDRHIDMAIRALHGEKIA